MYWRNVTGRLYMTTHQQDSSQPQQSQDSPQETGLGLMMVETEEATLAGMMIAFEVLLNRQSVVAYW